MCNYILCSSFSMSSDLCLLWCMYQYGMNTVYHGMLIVSSVAYNTFNFSSNSRFGVLRCSLVKLFLNHCCTLSIYPCFEKWDYKFWQLNLWSVKMLTMPTFYLFVSEVFLFMYVLFHWVSLICGCISAHLWPAALILLWASRKRFNWLGQTRTCCWNKNLIFRLVIT